MFLMWHLEWCHCCNKVFFSLLSVSWDRNLPLVVSLLCSCQTEMWLAWCDLWHWALLVIVSQQVQPGKPSSICNHCISLYSNHWCFSLSVSGLVTGYSSNWSLPWPKFWSGLGDPLGPTSVWSPAPGVSVSLHGTRRGQNSLRAHMICMQKDPGSILGISD